ncbi:hypothetical protein Peur_014196 [Populus x canadensis]
MGTTAREGCGRCHNFFGNKMIVEKGHERVKRGWCMSEGMGRDRLLLATVGPPIKARAGLRRKQAGRGSYRGS